MRRSLPGLALATFLVPSALCSAVFTVNTPIDAADGNPGDGICLIGSLCSLRAAIMEANALAGGPHVIRIDALPVKLVIAAGDDDEAFGDLNVLADMRIEGVGPLATSIEGTGSDRVFDVEAALEMSNLTVLGGRTDNPGGGIRVRGGGNLSCRHCRVVGNRSAREGGGLYVEELGVATLLDSLVAGNLASSSGCGGGVATRGALGLERSHVLQNRALGAFLTAGLGGGVCGGLGSAVSIRDSTVSANEAEGGSASYGGGILMAGGTWDLLNVTISGNRAATGGGGLAMISNTATLLNNVTVAANSATDGGGFYWSNGLTTALFAANSVFGDNLATNGPDCRGVLASLSGHNLLESTDDCSISGVTTGNKLGVDPQLLPLGSYGGPTPTHELASQTSPAFAGGSNATCEPADQRGVARPRGTCEMGATEFVGLVPVRGELGGVFSPPPEATYRIGLVTTWANLLPSDATVTGSITSLTSPGAPPDVVLSIPDGAASYGTIPAGFAASCLSGPTPNCYEIHAEQHGPRPGTHWDLTLVERTASLPLSLPWRIHLFYSFRDLPASELAFGAAESAFHHGAMSGCGADTFCPRGPVTRGQLAVLLERARRGPFYRPRDAAGLFSDLSFDDPRAPWAELLAADGVTAGCGPDPDGDGPLRPPFCPDSPVAMRWAALWLLRSMQAPLPPACVAGSERYDDVPASDATCRWIEEATRRLWIAGCVRDPDGNGPGKGKFCPDDPLQRQQLARLLERAYDYGQVTF